MNQFTTTDDNLLKRTCEHMGSEAVFFCTYISVSNIFIDLTSTPVSSTQYRLPLERKTKELASQKHWLQLHGSISRECLCLVL